MTVPMFVLIIMIIMIKKGTCNAPAQCPCKNSSASLLGGMGYDVSRMPARASKKETLCWTRQS